VCSVLTEPRPLSTASGDKLRVILGAGSSAAAGALRARHLRDSTHACSRDEHRGRDSGDDHAGSKGEHAEGDDRQDDDEDRRDAQKESRADCEADDRHGHDDEKLVEHPRDRRELRTGVGPRPAPRRRYEAVGWSSEQRAGRRERRDRA
jgi:hypothetical protein